MKDDTRARPEAPRSQAVSWLARLITADDISAEWPGFKAWLGKSPRNRADFNQVEALWRARKASISAATSYASPVTPRLEERRAWTVVAAASFMGICGCGWCFREPIGELPIVQRFAATKSHGTYATEPAEQRHLNLSDASEIQLNANSEVTLNLTRERREVSLERGTALFKVSKDATGRPFDVVVGPTTVRAVGTIFSVTRKSAGAAETVVEQGSVRIISEDAELARLNAGQAATVAGGSVQLQAPKRSGVDARLAWTTGQFSFSGESLAEAVASFNSYNKRQLVIADPDIGTLPVGGVFTADDPDGFAEILVHTFGIRRSLDAAGAHGAGTISLQAPPGKQAVGQQK